MLPHRRSLRVGARRSRVRACLGVPAALAVFAAAATAAAAAGIPAASASPDGAPASGAESSASSSHARGSQARGLLGDVLGDVRNALPGPVRDVVDAVEPLERALPDLPPQAQGPPAGVPPANTPPADVPPANTPPGNPLRAQPAEDGESSSPAVVGSSTGAAEAPSSPPAGGGADAPRDTAAAPGRTTAAARPQSSGDPGRSQPASAPVPAGGNSRGDATGDTEQTPQPATAGDAPSTTAAAGPSGTAQPSSSDTNDSRGGRERGRAPEPAAEDSPAVVRTVRDIVEVVPGWVRVALAGLALLCLVLAGAYLVSLLRARSLRRQRGELLRDVGLLQRALLPQVPAELGALATSVGYRPAEGPAAGGDFYDALPLADGRVGFIIGDVSGHGRDALERTAFVRHSLRAYLKAGLEPRVALQVAGRVIGDGLGDDFVTVLVAVHDPDGGSLTYASAGHPAPIVTGDRRFEPVLAGASPPIGFGLLVGQRQTTIPLPPGAVACLYTDGLVEARTEGGFVSRDGLERILEELGPHVTASELIERVSATARSLDDDMAACLLTPTRDVAIGGFRTEQLDLSAREVEGPMLTRFLEQCRVDPLERELAEREVQELGPRFGGVGVTVVLGSRRTVEVLPRNVESLEAAARTAAAAA